MRFDTDVSYFQIFELLLCFCSIEGVRSRISRSVLSTLDFNGRQQFSDMLIGPVNQVKEPLLATVHWAQQSPDTHDEAPLYALDFLTELYEVTSESFMSRFMMYNGDFRIVRCLVCVMYVYGKESDLQRYFDSNFCPITYFNQFKSLLF